MKKRRQAVIVGAARTPIGKLGGAYSEVSAEDLAVDAVSEALGRSMLDERVKIDHILGGMVLGEKDGQQIFLPRNVAFRAAERTGHEQLKESPALLEQRICGTGFQLAATAATMIEGNYYGRAKCIVIFGTENMTRAPQISTGKRKQGRPWDHEGGVLLDPLKEIFQHRLFKTNMAATAEYYGLSLGITREDCDAYAVLSHMRAVSAWHHDKTRGLFPLQVMDAQGAPVRIEKDEGARLYAHVEGALQKLAALSPLQEFEGVTDLVTPGNASQISDGAAALVLMERKYADSLGVKYEYEIADYQVATVHPTLMGQGPVPAIQDLLRKVKKSVDDIDLFEINEAFAAQYLAVEKELGLPRDRTNVNGGAIAIGHPLAATGLRITTDLLYELKRQELDSGIGSACIGGGQGIAVCIQRVT